MAYTVAEAAKQTGVKRTKISWLLYTKLIVPDVSEPTGSGDHALLSDRNLNELLLIDRLNRSGMTASTQLKAVLVLLRESPRNWWESESWLVRLDDAAWFVTDNLNQPQITNADVVFVVRIKGGVDGRPRDRGCG